MGAEEGRLSITVGECGPTPKKGGAVVTFSQRGGGLENKDQYKCPGGGRSAATVRGPPSLSINAEKKKKKENLNGGEGEKGGKIRSHMGGEGLSRG